MLASFLYYIKKGNMKTQEYSLSQDGLKTTVTDTTTWGDEDGARSSYAIIIGLLKYNTSGFLPCSLAGSPPVNTSDENPQFVFDNSNDGYYKIRSVYAGIDTSPSEEGSVYYDVDLDKIFLYSDGSFSEVTYNELMSYSGTLLDEVILDIGFSPTLEKAIDKIWYEYFKTRQIHNGKEYKDFSLLYALLIGARSSLLETAYVEFDSKIENANKIAQRKLKDIKKC